MVSRYSLILMWHIHNLKEELRLDTRSSEINKT